MAFLDDLKDSLKLEDLKDSFSEVTRTVAEKSGQFVGIQKLRLKESNLKGDVKKTYLELGKKVYEESNAGTQFSEDIAALVEKIDAGLAAIKEVQEQIVDAKAAANEEDIFDVDDDDDVFETEEAPAVEEAAAEEEAPAAEEEVVEEAPAAEEAPAEEPAAEEETPAEAE